MKKYALRHTDDVEVDPIFSPNVEFCGYRCVVGTAVDRLLSPNSVPHPSENFIHVRIQMYSACSNFTLGHNITLHR